MRSAVEEGDGQLRRAIRLVEPNGYDLHFVSVDCGRRTGESTAAYRSTDDRQEATTRGNAATDQTAAVLETACGDGGNVMSQREMRPSQVARLLRTDQEKQRRQREKDMMQELQRMSGKAVD